MSEAIVDLFAIHIIPTLQVFLGMLPVYVVLTRSDRTLGWLDLVALLVGLGGVSLSFVADAQMYRFAREFSFWMSLALSGIAAAPDSWWWVFAGTLAMYAMFQFASIPMMEKRSLERRPSYQDVIDRVPRFVPRPSSMR